MKTKAEALWVNIEERDSIKKIQLSVFGAAIGFAVGYIAKDFMMQSPHNLSYSDQFAILLYFSLYLFFLLAMGYVSNRGDIGHVLRSISKPEQGDVVDSRKMSWANVFLYRAKLIIICFAFCALVITLFYITSSDYFFSKVYKLEFIELKSNKNYLFTLFVGTIYATWFATSYWINKEFPDPMDELFPAKEAEKNTSMPP
ncbi:MAG: hypothetical protein HQL44_01280 [Alphaproteobacteria bacterium]|nr:hypothetical protein [Alphaproteobacteria bacterium]